MKTKAAIQLGGIPCLSIVTGELEEPRDTEVLVKIVACGICHTDVIMRQPNFLLGHEGCGIVLKTGRMVSSVSPGDHVVISYTHCGQCGACRANCPYECELLYDPYFLGYRADGTTPVSLEGRPIPTLIRQGSFAEHAVVDESSLVKVQDSLPLARLAPFGCGLMTGAGAIVNYLQASENKSIVICGLGGVGFGALMAAKVQGCHPIIAIDRIDDRLQLAKTIGADEVINADICTDIINTVMQCNDGKKLDYGYDTTGSTKLLQVLEQCLATNAMACGVGGGYLNKFHWKTIDEGHAIPQAFIPKMIGWYSKGLFPIDKLIRYYSFEQGNEALEDFEMGKVIKPVLLMQQNDIY